MCLNHEIFGKLKQWVSGYRKGTTNLQNHRMALSAYELLHCIRDVIINVQKQGRNTKGGDSTGNSSKRLASDLCMKSVSKIPTLDILPSMQILHSDTSASQGSDSN